MKNTNRELELERLEDYSEIPEDHVLVFIRYPIPGVFVGMLLGCGMFGTVALLYRLFVTAVGFCGVSAD